MPIVRLSYRQRRSERTPCSWQPPANSNLSLPKRTAPSPFPTDRRRTEKRRLRRMRKTKMTSRGLFSASRSRIPWLRPGRGRQFLARHPRRSPRGRKVQRSVGWKFNIFCQDGVVRFSLKI